MTVIVLWPFLLVPWVDLQCVIVVFPDFTSKFMENHCSLRFNYGNLIIGKLNSQSI